MEKIVEIVAKIASKSETIGSWSYFLDRLENWSSPSVTIAQNNLKKLRSDRKELLEELLLEISKTKDK